MAIASSTTSSSASGENSDIDSYPPSGICTPTGVSCDLDGSVFSVPSKLDKVFQELSKSSAAYFLSNSPIQSNWPHPQIDPTTISPVKPCYSDLLIQNSETECEKLLMDVLQDARVNEAYYKG
jgi:hypothetical protein